MSRQTDLVISLPLAFLLLLLARVWVVTGRPDAQFHDQGEWHTTSWEACEPEKVFQAGVNIDRDITPTVGIQRRTLTCVSVNATVLPPSWCGGGGAPLQQRRCVVPQPCRVDAFSSWETVQQGCRGESDDQIVAEIQTRRRRILQPPIGLLRQHQEVDECPLWEERRVIDQPSQLPLCNQRYKWQPSPWSACRAETYRSDDSSTPVCGGGVQMRSLTCLRLSDSRPVNPQLCSALALLPIIQHCEIPCDSDCQVSDWSPWSSCTPSSCAGIDLPELPGDKDELLPSGFQFRHRRILSNASAEGTECPPLSQLRRCRTASSDFGRSNEDWTGCARWEVQPLLDTCHLAENATCGQGYHELAFRCRRFDGMTVDDELCSNTTLPPLEQVSCVVHCPSDCILSPWSEWTACLHQGRRRRTRYVIGLPLPGSYEPCSKHQLMDEQICSRQEQDRESSSLPVFNWWPLPWGRCQLSEEEQCGNGVRHREVRCIRGDGQHVDDLYCQPLNRPDFTKSCTVPCPEECRVSDWSEWSECSNSDQDAIQSRIRVVLQQPSSSGSFAFGSTAVHHQQQSSFSSCPPLTEKRSCLDLLVQQEHIQWQLGPWSPCHLSLNAKCGTGLAVRSAYCRDGNNVTLDPAVCLSKLMDPFLQLELHRECSIPCHKRNHGPEFVASGCPSEEALASSAASGNLCPRNCIGTRILPGKEGDGCELREQDCPCERITLEFEDWSVCLIEDHLLRGNCGRGTQIRRRKCIVTSTGQLAPLHWCNEENYESRPCQIPCPTDCQLSPWSSWTACNSSCGPGIQRRHRKIEVEPADNGRPCGSMEEIQACHVHSCDAYQWRTSDWTPCHSETTRVAGCGDASQTRYVRCVNVEEDVVVDDSVCDASIKPPSEQSCRISCPGECVISQWSNWSSCQHCQGERKRERSIIRNPIYNSTPCPALEEVQPCSDSCRPHNWQVSEWSSCLPLGGSNCGEGVRNRLVSCVRSDGYVVDPSNCDPHTKPELTEMWCHVECPIDCQVSPWSIWDETECSPCGHHSGLRSRHREILMVNNQYGRPCPSVLRQQVPCPYRPCYEWRPFNWTECLLDGAHCGTGSRHQIMVCILAETGKAVDAEFCRLRQQEPSSRSKSRSLARVAEASCKLLCSFEKAAKVALDEEEVLVAGSAFPAAVEDDITVYYYPNDGEFNIWMVAMIAIGSLFLVFVGVTIALICTTRDEASGCKRKPSQSGGGPATEVRIHKSTNRPNTTRTEATALQEDVEK